MLLAVVKMEDKQKDKRNTDREPPPVLIWAEERLQI